MAHGSAGIMPSGPMVGEFSASEPCEHEGTRKGPDVPRRFEPMLASGFQIVGTRARGREP